jgi:hypothetical protein
MKKNTTRKSPLTKMPAKKRGHQFKLPGMEHPQMGRPLSGRKMKKYWIAIPLQVALKELATRAGLTEGQQIENWTMEAWNKASV